MRRIAIRRLTSEYATHSRACPCTKAPRRGYDDADYPAAREPWRCKRFWCHGCKSYVPWCCGVADERPELCDDCAAPHTLRTAHARAARSVAA